MQASGKKGGRALRGMLLLLLAEKRTREQSREREARKTVALRERRE
jgi:hypothetical protein